MNSNRYIVPSRRNFQPSLRSLLLDHLKSLPKPEKTEPARWAGTHAPPPFPSVDHNGHCLHDPATLLEDVKIFQQYCRLLSQARFPISRHLEWFEPLALPFQGLPDASLVRIHQLLDLHPDIDRKNLHRSAQALVLAKSLPHYDRDLTAYYLMFRPGKDMALPLHEYELQVAHSILRLHDPPTVEDLFERLRSWRDTGLVHVLMVAAHNMPVLASWGLEESPSTLHIQRLLRTIFAEKLAAIELYVASASPATDQHFLTLLDKLAALMRVKSDAEEEHDLSVTLANAFPEDENPSISQQWGSLRHNLERSMPPSLLILDPIVEAKRAKLHAGTWYAPLPSRISPSQNRLLSPPKPSA